RQAGDPRQLRKARADRRRHRTARGYPERQRHRLLEDRAGPHRLWWPWRDQLPPAAALWQPGHARVAALLIHALAHLSANLGAVRCSTRPSSAPLARAAILFWDAEIPHRKKRTVRDDPLSNSSVEDSGDRGDDLGLRLFRKQTVAPGGILELAGVQLGIVGLAQRDVFLAIHERQEGVALAPGDGRHLVQRAARKHQRAAFRRPVGLAAELGEHEIAAVEIIVEID